MPSLDAGIRIVGFSNSRPLGVYGTFRLWPGRAKHRRLKSPSRKNAASPRKTVLGVRARPRQSLERNPQSLAKSQRARVRRPESLRLDWAICFVNYFGGNDNGLSFGKKGQRGHTSHICTGKPLKVFWLTSRKSLAYLRSVCGRSMGSLHGSR